ncbi:MAG: hypothetical protein M3Y18_04195 [Candidatus Eremiobacteraeota bacterium]|nr:hypothetical protein [Candidatus Eremiobacteraeota bacterium]
MTALEMARHYRIAIEFADLGDWGAAELRAEYDPEGPVIRINTRAIARVAEVRGEAFVATAIGHEIYHHRERIGELPRLRDAVAREAAADAFGRELSAAKR